MLLHSEHAERLTQRRLTSPVLYATMLAECQAGSRQNAVEASTPNSESILCMQLHSVYVCKANRQALLSPTGDAAAISCERSLSLCLLQVHAHDNSQELEQRTCRCVLEGSFQHSEALHGTQRPAACAAAGHPTAVIADFSFFHAILAGGTRQNLLQQKTEQPDESVAHLDGIRLQHKYTDNFMRQHCIQNCCAN